MEEVENKIIPSPPTNTTVFNSLLSFHLPIVHQIDWFGFVWKSFGIKRLWGGDFPGGPVVENPPCNAGDEGSIPGRGTKIPHAVGQLSPRATTKDPAYRN